MVWPIQELEEIETNRESGCVKRSIESRLRLIRFSLALCVAGAVGAVISVQAAEKFGFTFPHHFLLFLLLALAYCFFFFLWQLKRVNRKPK
jgi:cyanate permease